VNVLLTVASSSVTGPAERLLGNALCLQAAGHVATVAFDTVRPGDFVERARERGVTLEPGLALSRSVRPMQVVRDVRRLASMLREGRAELIHSHFSHDHHLALLAATGSRDRTRIVRAAETPENLRPSLARSFAYRRTDGFEVATEARARQLVGEFGVAPERVVALAGAVDPQRFIPVDRAHPSRLREKLGVAPDAPLVGIVARMKPERLHRELIAAFALLRPDFPKARLAIVGRGEGEPALRAQVDKLGLDQSVLFAGYWGGEELVEAYQGLDVAVWLADGNDGSARGVLEAMACGLPVIAGATGASAEIVLDQRSGLLVQPGDVPALSRALARLMLDGVERRAFGEAGRQRVLDGYSWAQRGPALLEFYKRIRELPSVQ
jgi:glycosyltransferase involved in cell wall biosynthesis